MVSQEVNYSPIVTKRVSAEYLAQQGVQYSVRMIDQRISALNNLAASPTSAFNNKEIDYRYAINGTFSPSVTLSGSQTYGKYSVNYAPTYATANNQNGFQIQSTGTVGKYTTTITAMVSLTTKTVNGTDVKTLFDATNNDVKSNNLYRKYYDKQGNLTTTTSKAWTVAGDNSKVAQPSTDYNYIAFKDNPIGKDSGVGINYYADCGDSVSGHSSDNGYGIYYGFQETSSSTAVTPTSYVFQYDPGAHIDTNGVSDGGAFFVKKIINGAETSYYTNGFESNDGTTGDATNNGTVRVSLNDLKEIMKNYYDSTPADELPNYLEKDANGEIKPFSLLGQMHGINIDVSQETADDGTVYYHHIVKCDGRKILDFVDHDTDPKNAVLSKVNGRDTFNNTCTGFRTWELQSCAFYNSPTYLEVIPGEPTAKSNTIK